VAWRIALVNEDMAIREGPDHAPAKDALKPVIGKVRKRLHFPQSLPDNCQHVGRICHLQYPTAVVSQIWLTPNMTDMIASHAPGS
jgi:hypothetical protein